MNSRMHVHTNVGMMMCTMLALQLLLCMHIVRGKDTLCPFKRFASSSFPRVRIMSMQENSRVSCLGGCITQNRICMRTMILLPLFVQGRIVPSAKRRSLRRFMVNSSFSWHIVIGATIFYLLGGVVFPPALACGIIQAYRRCLLHACNKWVMCCRAQSLTPSTQATTPRGSKWRMMPRCGRRPMSTSPRPC